MGIDSVINKINSFFQAVDAKITKVVPMPAIMLLCAALSSKGLSALRSVSNVCQSLEENGIPTGPNPDGSPNKIVIAAHAIIEEIFRAMTEDACVQGGVQVGESMIISQGANAAGPVVSTGTNILPVFLSGKIF